MTKRAHPPRRADGRYNPTDILTSADHRAIRERWALRLCTADTRATLARDYGVTTDAIGAVLCGRIGRDAGGPLADRAIGHIRPPKHGPPAPKSRPGLRRDSKLTPARVAEARRLIAAGLTSAETLARRWHCDRAAISRAVRGLTWKSVTDPAPLPTRTSGRRCAVARNAADAVDLTPLHNAAD